MSDLDILIKNLSDISTGKIWKRKDIKLKIYEVYFNVLLRMAQEQTVDTGYSRALIVKVFAEKFGFNSKELQDLANEFYYYWKEQGWRQSPTDRGWTTASEGEDLKISFIDDDVFLNIADEGVVKQNNNSRIAINHPRPDNDRYRGHHLDYVSHLVNSDNEELVKISLNKLADDVANEIIKGLK